MSKETVNYPVIGGIYEHYKGGKYKVITMCSHSETNEAMVVYKSLLFGSVYVKPLTLWLQKVDDAGPLGSRRTRFELTNEQLYTLI